MFRYLNGTRVKVLRYFIVDGVHYSEVILNGEGVIVETNKLSDENRTVFTVENENLKSTTEITPESVTISFDEKEAVVGTTVIDKSGVTVEGDFEVEIEPVAEKQPNVIATNNKGKTFNLGAESDLSNSSELKKLKLDVEAVIRCLNHKQKQHKGFTFELK